jgi:hypothetical protein
MESRIFEREDRTNSVSITLYSKNISKNNEQKIKGTIKIVNDQVVSVINLKFYASVYSGAIVEGKPHGRGYIIINESNKKRGIEFRGRFQDGLNVQPYRSCDVSITIIRSSKILKKHRSKNDEIINTFISSKKFI